jgi:hypothetical protein
MIKRYLLLLLLVTLSLVYQPAFANSSLHYDFSETEWFGGSNEIKDAQANTAATVADTSTAIDYDYHWKFEEATGSTSTDSEGNQVLNLTNTTWGEGQLGQALRYNGSASATLDGPLIDTTTSFSVSAWVKLDQNNYWRTFVSQDGNNVSGFYLQFSQYFNGGSGAFIFSQLASDNNSAAAYRTVSTTIPVTGQWYHITGVKDTSTQQLRLYING